MRLFRFSFAILLLLGIAATASAQALTTSDIPAPVREYRPRQGMFVGIGGGLNLGFNGNSFQSRELSGMGLGTALDLYAGMMTRKDFWGFGLGVQGLSVSDRYTEYGRKQYMYFNGRVFMKLGKSFIPYFHVGATMAQGFSPAGGLGLMLPIPLSDNISLVPDLRFSAMKGSVLSENASKVGMVVSASVGLRFDIGKENRHKKARKRVEDAYPAPEPIRDTVTIIQHDTIRVEREYVIIRDAAPAAPVVREDPVRERYRLKEEQFNRDLANTLLFETGSSILTTEARGVLNRVADYILDSPGTRTLVEGHTDDVGNDEYNLQLSRNRAAAVMEYLIARGVNPFMISSAGYGKTRPLVPNTNAENRSRNRRVELHFSSGER